MVLLSDAYRRAGKHVAAWEMIKEALQQYPADAGAQRAAREIEEELHRSPPREGEAPPAPLEDVILLPEGAFEIRPADLPPGGPGAPAPAGEAEVPPPAPPVRTITLANIYWEQGEKETARRIVDEILMRDPGDHRAMEWKKVREEGRAAEAALAAFLGAIGKEYGYELSGPH
jgi:tetratricopeptide (TPR) repeat protein